MRKRAEGGEKVRPKRKGKLVGMEGWKKEESGSDYKKMTRERLENWKDRPRFHVPEEIPWESLALPASRQG